MTVFGVVGMVRPAFLSVYTYWVQEWRHDCAVSSQGGSVKIENAVSNEEEEKGAGPIDIILVKKMGKQLA
jgi:hypothetical protein